MNVSQVISCPEFSCADVVTKRFTVPDVDIAPERIRIVMVSEAAPADPADWYWAPGTPLFAETTVQAFQDAGVEAASMADIMALGVYITPAVKCAKIGYGIKATTTRACSALLERELDLFPNVVAYLLMGDVAIKAVNAIARRRYGQRAIPAGSTYKIRAAEHWFGDTRAFPSYLQAGKSFFIEKSKRRMIAEDISAAMRLLP